MHAGHLRCEYGFPVLAFLEPANIGRNRIGKQLNVLRQIAEVLAERRLGPDRDIGAIKADGTGAWPKHADDVARECRLSCTRRADNPQHFARIDIEGYSAQDRLGVEWHNECQALNGKAPLWPWQREPCVR